MSLLGEFRRRKIVQVAAVYAVVAWLLVQIITSVEEPLSLPDWTDSLVIVLLAIGFPITLIISWAFNLTHDGLVRDSGGAEAAAKGRGIEYALIGLLIVAVGWILFRIEIEGPPGDGAAGAAGASVTQAGPGRLPNSVAVLPFAALSQNPDDAFFAEGIHDELLNQLAQNSSLNVIGRTAVLRYANTELPFSQIAEELNVETLVEGTIRYGRERIRLTAQLIDPATGTHLWSQTYDREFDVNNVFEIETDVATSIARELEVEFSVADSARIAEPLTESTEAWRRYRQAMALISGNLNPWEAPETLERFHALLDEAIAIDPGFAAAWAVKGIDYAFSIISPRPQTDTRTPADWERLAFDAAERALEIDPGNGLAYMAMGLAHHYARRGDAAIAAFDRALALDPSNLQILDDAARVDASLGRMDEAVRRMQRVVELDPGQIDSLAWMLFLAGRYDEAADLYAEVFATLSIDADNASNAALVEVIRGNSETARDYLRLSELPENAGSWESARALVAARQTYVYGRIGDDQAAARRFAEFRALAEKLRVGDTSWALALLGMDETEQALERLRAAADKSFDDGMNHLFAHNAFADPILEQAEFVQIRSGLGYLE